MTVDSFTRWTTNKRAAEKAAAGLDPLVQAVIDREVAEDNYFETVYRLGTCFPAGKQARDFLAKYLQRMIDARMVAMLEADAAGLINLFDGGEDTADLIASIADFTGVTIES